MPVILFTGMLLFSCQSRQAMNPDQALNTIKVFDSDLTNLSDKTQQHTAFKAIDFLIRETSSPFNKKSGITGFVSSDSMPPIQQWYGRHTWDRDSLKFIYQPGQDGIEVFFPSDDQSLNDLLVVVPGIGCHPFFSKPCFPDNLNARLMQGKDEIFLLDYQSVFNGDYPEKINFNIDGVDFDGHFIANRTRVEKEGVVTAEFGWSVKGIPVLTGRIVFRIGYNENQIFVKTFEPDFTIFNIRVEGRLDYSRVDPTSKDYIASFNKNCHINLTERNSGRMIGKFGIGTDKSGELLEWIVLLTDGSSISLYDHVLAFRKVMDYKYPNEL